VLDFIDDNRDKFMVQALGVLVSHWTKWEAGKIMDVFMAALQDVNYDELMQQIREEIIDNPRSKLYA
jgi:ribosomal protein L12E/L44/L45/RPP1/RPP2